jgi:serine/threonine-protein kinase RsbW
MEQEPSELHLTVPAKGGYLAPVRKLVQAHAFSAGFSAEKANDVVLAVHEACANVVVHAYGEEGGPLRLQSWSEAGGLVIEVSDNGTPVANPEGRPGASLGLGLIRRLADHVDIEGPGEYGTRLEMTFRSD